MTATGPLHETTSREDTPEDRSIGELFSAISADLSTLIRQELALAKAEVRQSATRAGAGAGLLGGAGYAAGMVLLFLSIAAWWGIGQWTGNAWSGVIVAVVWAIVAAILYAVGRSKLREVEGVPQTTETAKKIPSALAGNEETR
jgi:Putative Actinobacterial Holin-X, holin superfamily III